MAKRSAKKVVHLFGTENGSHSAFLDGLYKEHRAGVLQFIRLRVASLPVDAEDVTQEVFAKVVDRSKSTKHEDLKGIYKRSYLLSMANNLLVDMVRKQRVRKNYADTEKAEAEQEVSSVSHIEDIVSAQRKLEVFKRELAKVKPLWRQAFLLFRVEGLNYREVGLRIGVTPRQAEYYVNKVWAKLKSANRDEFGFGAEG